MISDISQIFVTGYKGNVGKRLVKLGCSLLTSDVTQERELFKEISDKSPKLILHLAAKSSTDFCEKLENQEIVSQTNLRGASNVFASANAVGSQVVLLSTDQVFSGRWFGSYKETSRDIKPVNYYALTKTASEALSSLYENVKIVRTSTLLWKDRPILSEPIDKIRRGEVVHSPVFMTRSFMHIDHFIDNLLSYCYMYDNMPRVLNISGGKTVSWFALLRNYSDKLGLDSSKVHRQWFDKKGFTPRPHRVGLSMKLAKECGLFANRPYNYLDAIEKML